MLGDTLVPGRFHDATSHWVRSFSCESVKCLIVCRGPVRKEAIQVFDAMGIHEYGMLLSEKDSIVYPKCLAPELRDFRFPRNVHRVPDYMGHTADEKAKRIREIVQIAVKGGYTHVFAGYGFMAEDAEFIEAIERSGVTFVGPASSVARRAGAKDEAKKLARKLKVSVTPGVDNVSALALVRRAKDRAGLEALAREHGLGLPSGEADLEEAAEAVLQAGYARQIELVTVADLQAEAVLSCQEIWAKRPGKRVRLKYVGGGGGKGQRVIASPEEVAAAVVEVCAESKVMAPGSNRNFLIELNIEHTRHNEIQLIGNGTWCLSLGGRDCSVQMHEQKLLELSLTRELLDAEIEAARHVSPGRAAVLAADAKVLAEMEAEAERFGEAVELDSVSTFESIVEGKHHYFMEMNTRIQVEHRVTEMVYRLRFQNPTDKRDVFYVDSLIEAMVLLAVHGKRLPKPERVLRSVAGAEVRVNATNHSLQPHAGGVIWSWSKPLPFETRDDQGIGTRNPDTGAFVFYNLAGAYDSNIALLVTDGTSRRDCLARLAEILRRTEIRGYELETNLHVHYGLVSWLLGNEPMLKPTTQFMSTWLPAVGALEVFVRDVDLELAWQEIVARAPAAARETLRRKETLILRPIQQLFANGHLLAGFLGLERGKLWKRVGDDFAFASNPVTFLDELYHYLDLEADNGRAPCLQIWDHDERILANARAFYARVAELSGETDWDAIQRLLSGGHSAKIARDDTSLWDACVGAHLGFQAGLELLLMIPRIGRASGFSEIKVDEKLEVVFPEALHDPARRAELVKALSPAPVASSDEIVTPVGGHFYAREAPHLPPLVQEGDHFAKGQPLFVIEVMKMFNKILAPFSGTLKRELLRDRDGHIVVKGQPVFKIVPDEVRKVESAEDIAARRRGVTLRMAGWAG